MKDEKGNVTIKSIYHWLRSDSGKKYSFFIFYFFFFLVLIIFINTNQTSVSEKNKTESVNLPFSTINIENKNYDFTLTNKINDLEIKYTGNREENNITLSNDNDSKKYNFIIENGNLTNQDNIDLKFNLEFLNIFEIKRILKKGILASEVKFPQSEKYEYNYEITTKELGKILNLDLESENVNKITVETTKEKNLKLITLDITDFMNQKLGIVENLKDEEDKEIDTNLENSENKKEEKSETEDLTYSLFLIQIDYGEIYE